VGDNGVLAGWNGTTWLREPSPTQLTLRGIWGADGHYFAVGDRGTFLELKGGEWTSNQPSASAPKAIWGAAPDDVWAVGKGSVHWDGTSWARVDALEGLELSGVWGSAANDVWAVGKLGVLMHFDGRTWRQAASPTSDDVNGVWGSGAEDIWAVDAGGAFLRFDGGAWRRWPSESFGPLTAVYGNRADDVVAVGEQARAHFDGRAWTRLPSHPLQAPQYTTAFGDGANVFFGGRVNWSAYKAGGANPELGRWDGKMVVDDLEPAWNGNAVVICGWTSAPADVWLGLTALVHWDGRAWTKAALANTISSVSALGATREDLWAATTTGQILRKRLR